MKKFILSAVSVFVLVSCAAVRERYDSAENYTPFILNPVYFVEKSERSIDNKTTYLSTAIQGTTSIINDDLIEIQFEPSDKVIYLRIQNNSGKSIKVLWDEAVFVDNEGSSLRLVHGGVRFGNIEKEQVPATIAKGTELKDMIVPADNVIKIKNGTDYDFSPLTRLSLRFTYTREMNKILNEKTKGELAFKILIPIEISGVKQEYTTTFFTGRYKLDTDQSSLERLDYWDNKALENYSKGKEALASKQYENALIYALNATDLFPRSTKYLSLQADVLSESKQCTSAKKTFLKLCELGESSYCKKECSEDPTPAG